MFNNYHGKSVSKGAIRSKSGWRIASRPFLSAAKKKTSPTRRCRRIVSFKRTSLADLEMSAKLGTDMMGELMMKWVKIGREDVR